MACAWDWIKPCYDMLGFHVSFPAISCHSFNVSRFQICERSKTQLLLLRSHACPHTSIDDESCDEPKRASTWISKSDCTIHGSSHDTSSWQAYPKTDNIACCTYQFSSPFSIATPDLMSNALTPTSTFCLMTSSESCTEYETWTWRLRPFGFIFRRK